MPNKIVYLNGEYLPLNKAKVSVLDRGFLFGDGVYEVIPCYAGRLFHFQQHLERLNNSLNSIRITPPYSADEWLKILTPLIDADKDQSIYLQITRGADIKRHHAFPDNIPLTVFAMSSKLLPYAGKDTGIKAITLNDTRWHNCNVKAITLLANILHFQNAIDQGSAEALMVNQDGRITEGASSNVFAVINGVLCTPPKDKSILPGITRDVIVELAKKNAIPCQERPITQDELKSASEVWITSTTREIIPVVELDSSPVGDGKPGSVFRTMDALFQDYKKSPA